MSYHEIRPKEKICYIYMHEDWERDNQIRDWQFQDINEILYRQKTKTIFHIMRYIQNSKKDLYIYMSFLLLWKFLTIWNIVFFFGDMIFHWYHEIANLIFDRLSFNLHVYIYIYIIFANLNVSHDMKYLFFFGDRIFHWYHEIANLIFDCVSLNLHLYINKYASFFLLWMYLTIWNIVFFFWRYNISLISWNCQSRIWSSLPLPLPRFFLSFLYILCFFLFLAPFSYLFFSFFLFISWYEISASFFFWRYNISLLSWNCQSHIWLCLSQSSFIYKYIYIFFSILDVSHDMIYRLLLLAT